MQEVRIRQNVTMHQDPSEGQQRGMDVSAGAIDMVNRGEGQAWLEAHGQTDETGRVLPAWIANDTFTLVGPKLGLDQQEDFAWVKGGGQFVHYGTPADDPKKTEPDTETAETTRPTTTRTADRNPDQADAKGNDAKAADGTLKLSNKGPMDIRWGREMQFFGMPMNAEGRVDNARALFLGRTRARSKNVWMYSDKLETYFDRAVDFQPPPEEPGTEKTKEEKPKPQIDLIKGFGDPNGGEAADVHIFQIEREEPSQILKQKKHIQGKNFVYQQPTGKFWVNSEGIVRLYGRKQGEKTSPTGNEREAEPPANLATPPRRTTVPAVSGPNGTVRRRPIADTRPARPQEPAQVQEPPPLELTRIAFGKQMTGMFGNGQGPVENGPFSAEFLGRVQVLHARVADENTDLSADRPPPDLMFLSADRLAVLREPLPEGAPESERFLMEAYGNAIARVDGRYIQCVRMTYDSVKELFYFYGDATQDVYIAQQDRQGHRPSESHGKAVMYNRKTGVINVINPKGFLLIDPKSGDRFTPASPPPPPSDQPAKKKPRNPLRRTPSSDKERKGFKGT